MKRIPALLGGSGLVVALLTVSCTTLGTHVKGGFTCRAPIGTCAPMTSIDAQAIAGLGAAGGSLPISGREAPSEARFITTSATGVPVRTGEHVMRVVFPAHTDQGGVYHEEAVAHLVTDRSIWTLREEEPPTAGSLDAAIEAQAPGGRPDAASSVASGQPGPTVSDRPLNLREAAAGLVAPSNPVPDQPSGQVAVDIAGPQSGAPSAAALAAARAGHRIGDDTTGTAGVPAPARLVASRHGHRPAIATPKATVPGAATAALNRAVLRNLKPVAALLSSHASAAGPAPVSHEIASAQVHP